MTPARDSRRSHALVLGLFFLSGASSLVYEVAWLRLLIPVLGADLVAVSTVLTAFLGGLALGSFLLGRLADRSRHPLRLYGILEIGVAGYALILPALLGLLSRGYLGVAGPDRSFGLVLFARFVVAAGLLAVPTVLMGGTLPALARALVEDPGVRGRRLGTLYAVNTWGAVIGTAAAGFVLLPALGVRGTTLLAAAVNVAVGLLAIALDREEAPQAAAPEPDVPSPTAPPATDWTGALVIAAFALSGFAALVDEVVWTRLLALVLGTTTYAFTTMLATFLFGLAAGGWLGSRIADRAIPHLHVMAGLQLAIAVSVAASVRLIEKLPAVHVEILLRSWETPWFGAAGLVAPAAVMLVPTLLFGAMFPLVARLALSDLGQLGRRLGLVYSANTFGAILGSAMAGFALVPLLGSERTLGVSAALNLVAGAALLALALRRSRAGRRGAVLAAAAVLAATAAAAAFTPWKKLDRSLLGRGIYYEVRRLLGRKDVSAADLREAETTIYEREGLGATVTVGKRANDDIVIRINGKPVASSNYADMRLQRMLGHLPVLLHPDPKDALVIGLGAGVTFGSTALHGLDTTAVELEEAVVGGAREFGPENAFVLARPNARVVIADGRNFLLTSPRRYDVLTSDPIHPWVAGAASLYSYEHFSLMRQRLKPGGVVCQWIPLYELSETDYRMIVRSFALVFPHTSLWFANIDSFLIGSDGPLAFDLPALGRRMADPAIRQDLAGILADDPFALLSAFVMADERLRGYVAGAPLNTDDRPLLEFTSPRALYHSSTVAGHIRDFLRFREPIDRFITDWGPDPAAARARLGLFQRTKGLTLRGRWLNLTGKKDEAFEEFKAAIEANPDDRDSREYMGGGISNRAVEAARKGDLEKAAQRFAEALLLNPTHFEAAFNLGAIAFQLGQMEGARHAFALALTLKPRSAKTAASLAATQQTLGDGEGAMGNYRKALELDPALAIARFNLGILHEERGDLAQAEREYRALLAAHPDDAEGKKRLEELLARGAPSPAAP